MATPKRNCELKTSHALNFLSFGSVISKFLSAENQFFKLKYSFCCCCCCCLDSGAQGDCTPPRSYTPVDNGSWPFIQGLPGGKVNILRGHSIGHSKKKKCIRPSAQFRTVSEIQLLYCIVVWIWRPILSFPASVLRHCLKHVNRCEPSVGHCDCW